jgi:protein-serine/threonine kinase
MLNKKKLKGKKMSTSKESTNNNKNKNEIKKSPEKNKISNSTSDDEDSTHQSPNQPREKIRDFVIIKEVGQGSFGSVFLVEKETNKKKYAIKVINKDFLSRTERTEEALIERLILSRCKHPSIVRLSLSFQTKHKLFFVIEYCPNKDLDELLRKFGTFEPDLALQIICELVNVLDYLHNKMEISHNDLKPSNILLDANFHIKLIDFSTAKVRGKIFDKSKGDFLPSDESISKDIIGTAEFISPEMVNQKITDYRTNDVWALGIIIYMLFNGESPFKDKNDFMTLDKVKEGKFTYIKKDIPEDVVDLINNILIEDTNKRLNIQQIKEHKYFKNNNINWDTILNNKVPIDLEKLNQLDKQSIENNNNENFWEQFCNDINSNTNTSNENSNNISESENDFEVKKNEIPPKIIKNFFYSKEQVEKKMEERGWASGIMKKCGFIEKEVKLKLNNKEKRIDVFDLEKNEIIKKFELNKKTKIKVEKNNELIIDGDKFKSSSSDVNNWVNNINKVIDL